MNAPSLNGLVVLNTRPAGQQASLSAAIEQAGGRVVSLPLLEIEVLEEEASISRIREQISRLERFQVLIFVSTNAAEIGVGWIRRLRDGLPSGLTVIGVGPTTGALLRELLSASPEADIGGSGDDGGTGSSEASPQIITAAGGMGSEAVLELPVLSAAQVGGRRVGIVRGRGGRELLADTLRRRGAEVEYVEVYRRLPRRYPAGEVPRLMAGEGVNVMVVTSGESLRYLKAAVADNIESVSLIPLVVPSARLRAEAEKTGFRRAVNADGSDNRALLAALAAVTAASPAP